MYPDELVFGILDTSKRIEDPRLAERLASFTLSWSRYGYRGRFLRHDNVNRILDEASALGYRWCLIQSYGSILSERWAHGSADARPLEITVPEWVADNSFFVMGHIIGDSANGYGLDDKFMLVDLASYVAFGRPLFDSVAADSVEYVEPVAIPSSAAGTGISELVPSGRTRPMNAALPGRNFIEASLCRGIPVYGFTPEMESGRIHLDDGCRAHAALFSSYLGENIYRYAPPHSQDELSNGQQVFLESLSRVVSNSRQGVFLWNLEPYDDVLTPPAEFRPPVSSLYSVAAGFKPNMILEALGFDERTRVVFFDYSPDALKVRQLLVEEWDGEDLPRFVRYIFKKFPYPQTFYYLWSGYTPDTVPEQGLYEFWELELEKWGGADRFKEHWTRYKNLEHEYLVCNLLKESNQLLARVEPEPNAVLWWSNLFFTMYSNWFYTVEERRTMYGEWLERLVGKNPDMFIYGSDYNNISVNHIRAKEYLSRFANGGDDYLNPLKFNQVEIRF